MKPAMWTLAAAGLAWIAIAFAAAITIGAAIRHADRNDPHDYWT